MIDKSCSRKREGTNANWQIHDTVFILMFPQSDHLSVLYKAFLLFLSFWVWAHDRFLLYMSLSNLQFIVQLNQTPVCSYSCVQDLVEKCFVCGENMIQSHSDPAHSCSALQVWANGLCSDALCWDSDETWTRFLMFQQIEPSSCVYSLNSASVTSNQRTS